MGPIEYFRQNHSDTAGSKWPPRSVGRGGAIVQGADLKGRLKPAIPSRKFPKVGGAVEISPRTLEVVNRHCRHAYRVAAIAIPIRYRDSDTNYQEDIAVVLLTQELMVTHAVRPACVNFDEKFDNEQLTEGNTGTVCPSPYEREFERESKREKDLFTPGLVNVTKFTL
ncbi:hypothetical protein MSG28_014496 [Choristoneura fumiferana]|uniref:Uncharacterized protein n=1 Tax=Choristoneura fumiferana TaxID=7141 RepID=A0ACC0JRP8_CHOFU|nr:hypothetical protein MSG28_014496 [Choristoneura fumiferana]